MTEATPHASVQPSPWITRFSPLVQPGASVLDVACGRGRHMHWFAQRGHTVTGVDRDAEALGAARAWGETVEADIENGPWPFADRHFGAVVVTNYLWRALFPQLFASVQPGGVLLYETFADGNASVGRPSSPEFLLQPGELLQQLAKAGPGWRVIAYEDGFLGDPDRFVQRIAAVHEAASEQPVRYPL